MTKAEEIIIQTHGHQIAARAWGPETGRKVLAVHGWLDNAASFDLLAPLLPDLHLVAIDMAGHGRSSHRAPGIPYHFVDFVTDVISAADGLGWEQFSFVSHSLGAGVSSFVSALLPERIEKLVLIEGLGPMAGDPSKAPEALLASIKQMRRHPGKRPPVYADVDALIEARMRAGDLSHTAAKHLIERSSQNCEGGITWTSDARLRFTSPLYLTEEQILAHLRAIKAPSLLINGEQGIITERAGMKQRYAAVGNLRVKTVPGGHHLHMENPMPVADEINIFLA